MHDIMTEPAALRSWFRALSNCLARGIRVDSRQSEAPSMAFVNDILALIKIGSGERNLRARDRGGTSVTWQA